MGVLVRIFRADLESAELCAPAFALFDSITDDGPLFEADWDELNELYMQQHNPIFVTWLRAKRSIPFGNFSGMDLSDLALPGADFRSCDLSGANLTGTVLANAQLQRANLCGANLGDAVIDGANFEGAYFDGEPPQGWVADEGFRLSQA